MALSDSNAGLIPGNDVAGANYLDRYDAVKASADDLIEYWTKVLEGVYNDVDYLVRTAANPDFYPPVPAAPGAVPAPGLPPTPVLEDLDVLIPDPVPPPTIGPYVPPTPELLAEPEYPDEPTCDGVNSVTPSFPSAPTVPSVDTSISATQLPDFKSTVTITTPPSLPIDVQVPLAPGVTPTPPIDTEVPDLTTQVGPVPDPPNIVIDEVDEGLYTVPELELDPINIPTLPVSELPTLPPVTDFLSCVYDTLCASLNDMLVNAQLDADYETASWDAALARENEAAQAELGNMVDVWGARGFDFPPGQMARVDIGLRQNIELRARAGSRDLYARRRELELQTRNAAVSASAQVYTAESQTYSLIARLQLEQTQFIATQSIRNYELALRAAQLETQKRDAQILEYNAQLDGRRALWDAEAQQTAQKTNIANLYTSQIRGVEAQASVAQTEMELYRTRVSAQSEAAKAVLDRDRLIFDTWRVQVEVVLEELKSQSIYADIIRAQATAITAEATAYEAQAKAQDSQINLQAKRIDAQLGNQQSQVGIYSAQVQAEADRIKALTDIEEMKQRTYVEVLRFSTEKVRAISEWNQANAQIQTAAVDASSRTYQAKVSAVGASATAQMGMYNAIAAQLNAKSSAQQADIALYRAGLDSINTMYRSQVQSNSDAYRQSLSGWTSAVQQKTTMFNSMITRLGFVGQYPSEIIRAALTQQVVSLSTGEAYGYNQSRSTTSSTTDTTSNNTHTNINVRG